VFDPKPPRLSERGSAPVGQLNFAAAPIQSADAAGHEASGLRLADEAASSGFVGEQRGSELLNGGSQGMGRFDHPQQPVVGW